MVGNIKPLIRFTNAHVLFHHFKHYFVYLDFLNEMLKWFNERIPLDDAVTSFLLF